MRLKSGLHSAHVRPDLSLLVIVSSRWNHFSTRSPCLLTLLLCLDPCPEGTEALASKANSLITCIVTANIDCGLFYPAGRVHRRAWSLQGSRYRGRHHPLGCHPPAPQDPQGAPQGGVHRSVAPCPRQLLSCPRRSARLPPPYRGVHCLSAYNCANTVPRPLSLVSSACVFFSFFGFQPCEKVFYLWPYVGVDSEHRPLDC